MIRDKKYIFDVDGTLTESRQKINPKFAIFFEKFMIYNDVYLVTGSDREKTIEQIGLLLYQLAQRVYNCSGSDVYEGSINVYRDPWELPIDAESWLSINLQSSEFPFRTGRHIERRPGMVNFSIVGRNANPTERKQYVKWDNETSERLKISRSFEKKFPDIEAKVAGETGLDIFPRGNNKSQILRDFNINEKLVFFGDKMQPNGNDYDLKIAITKEYQGRVAQRGICHEVKDYEDTWNILNSQFTNPEIYNV